MYFHDASTEAFVTWSGMSMADVIVVASIAIHMKPTLFEVTANSIVNVNRLAKMRNRRASRRCSRRRRLSPGPSHAASAATTLTQNASRAESASARRNSAGPGRQHAAAPARWRHSASAAPSGRQATAARSTQPTKRR